ncbi:MAG: UDP-N-acetylmuramyl-tripeptide synthetase [bacterium]|nr:UDP-N-acetylmuramyl-tripeptide synthetase [bacterium]
MLERILRAVERFIPKRTYRFFQPAYHFFLALFGAIVFRFPSRKLTVIMVTGTKGKTSTAELLNNIFEANGWKVALLGTLRFKIGETSERNMRKMTIPGRFFVERFLRRAVDAGCTHAIIEMTSEGARQYRHRFIDMDALIFTNLAPEHIESHGSYEKYRDAKLSIARSLARSSKSRRFMVANADDKEGEKFASIPDVTPISFRLTDGEPIIADERHVELTFRGMRINSLLPGIFNAYNILAAAMCASMFGVQPNVIAAGVARTPRIEGRMERIEAGQSFPVIVDYAHTPDSLEAVYKTFPNHQKICVLGNTGGGRDAWKRGVMGGIADTYCAHIILTNEDSYDEDPQKILDEMKAGFKKQTPEIILDRRLAIRRALELACGELVESAKETKNVAVLITGKGTDPYIMGPNGTKEPWDDRVVAREELQKLLGA